MTFAEFKSPQPKRPSRRIAPALRAALLAVSVLLAMALPDPAFAQCLSGGEARQAVASGQAQPLGAISARIRGKIVRAALCRGGGGLVYELSVLEGNQVRQVTVDARSGAVLR
jgi:Peptidase propeptide and YPEB domain